MSDQQQQVHGDYSNQTRIFDPNQFNWPVTLVGLGGTGSAIAFALHKMGIKELVGYDADVVSSHNVPVQMLYSQNDVTDPPTPKVVAAERALKAHPIDQGQTFVGHQSMVTLDEPAKFFGVVVMCVDTMDARKQIWELIQRPENMLDVPLVIDCRMGGDHFQVFTINPRDPKHVAIYESWLFGDEEAENEPYGQRAFVGVTLSLAGRVADHIARYSREEVSPPFYELSFSDDVPATLT